MSFGARISANDYEEMSEWSPATLSNWTDEKYCELWKDLFGQFVDVVWWCDCREPRVLCAGYRYLVGMLNKKTGKMKVYDADMFNLKPVLAGNMAEEFSIADNS